MKIRGQPEVRFKNKRSLLFPTTIISLGKSGFSPLHPHKGRGEKKMKAFICSVWNKPQFPVMSTAIIYFKPGTSELWPAGQIWCLQIAPPIMNGAYRSTKKPLSQAHDYPQTWCWPAASTLWHPSMLCAQIFGQTGLVSDIFGGDCMLGRKAP